MPRDFDLNWHLVTRVERLYLPGQSLMEISGRSPPNYAGTMKEALTCGIDIEILRSVLTSLTPHPKFPSHDPT